MLDPAIAEIIYFPSKWVRFQPTLEDTPLTMTQIEEIKSEVQDVSRFSNPHHQLMAKHIYNKLQVIFCVQRVEDIPAQHREQVFNYIKQVRIELVEFRCFSIELHKLFASHILRGRDPWVYSVKAKWHKKATEELPNRPDWNILAKEISNLSFKGGQS